MWKRKVILLPAVIVSVIVVLFLLLESFVVISGSNDSHKPADAILVLGARAMINQKLNPCLAARLAKASELYHQNSAPVLIVSGGNDKEDGINEASTMKKALVQLNVPEDAIREETAATSTFENFQLSKKILLKEGIQDIIIVTESFHMARASLVADALQIKHTNAPVKESACSKRLTYFLKEPFAIVVYKLQGKL